MSPKSHPTETPATNPEQPRIGTPEFSVKLLDQRENPMVLLVGSMQIPWGLNSRGGMARRFNAECHSRVGVAGRHSARSLGRNERNHVMTNSNENLPTSDAAKRPQPVSSPKRDAQVDFPTFSGHTLIRTNSLGRLERLGAEITK